MTADRGGFGGGLGVTDDSGRDLGGQVSTGQRPTPGGRASAPEATSEPRSGPSSALLAGIPGARARRGVWPRRCQLHHGPRQERRIARHAGAIAESASPRPGNSGSGGLLGVGNDTSNADALAALYTLLMAKQKAA